MIEEEIWKDIEGTEGLYKISNLGRVKSLPKSWYNGKCTLTSKERILKPKTGILKTGKLRYYTVGIRIDNILSYPNIHRLVAINFIPNPDNKPQVNHKDGNKLNNHFTNLEWVTSEENIQHAYDTGLHVYKGEKCNFSKFSEELVIKILSYKGSHLLHKEVAEMLNVKASYVSDIYRGVIWRHLSQKLNKELCPT